MGGQSSEPIGATSTDFSAYQNSKLSASADDPLGQLSALVMKGSAEAAQELHYTVAAAVQNLKWLSRKKPELFTPIASKKLVFCCV